MKKRGRKTLKETLARQLNVNISEVYSVLANHAEMANVKNIHEAAQAVSRMTREKAPCTPVLRKLIRSGRKSNKIPANTPLAAVNLIKPGRPSKRD